MFYIDSLRPYPQKKSGKRFSHLISTDSLESLHEFAHALGIRRHFYHSRPTPHYDVSEQYYESALKLGAVQCSSRDIVRISKMSKVFWKSSEDLR